LEKITEMADIITVKDNQLENLSEKIKHDLETITEMTDELFMCRGVEDCPIGRPNGIYKINKPVIPVFEAPCNSTGWMTILRRQNQSVDFNRNWANYTNGFGYIDREFYPK